MNGNRNGGATRNRGYRNIKLAPTTLAIRSALSLSAAMLALSGSGSAFAATTCTGDSVQIVCNGDFTDDVANDPFVTGNAAPDLTLVVGDDLATTVNPGAGVNGITSMWGGAATVISYAEINTSGADASIYMLSDDTATVSNFGSIYNEVTGNNQYGILVGAANNVYVTNGGDVTDSSAGTYDATGIAASSNDGSVSVYNEAGGSITGFSFDGAGTGVMAYGDTVVDIDNDGIITGSSFTGFALGVGAISGDGTTLDNSGTINAFGIDGYSLGVAGVSKYGDVAITSSGEIQAGGGGLAGGILAISGEGDATVTNSGTMEVASSTKYAGGIVASSKYDTAITTVTNSGEIDVSGYGLAIGTAAFGNGNVYVTNSGTIDVTSETTYAVGVGAYSKYADVSVTNSGSLSVMGYAGATGITANAQEGYSTVTTVAGSSIDAESYYNSTGISADGFAGATVTSAGEVYAHTGGLALGGSSFTSTGIEAYSAGGDAAVINSGSVEAVSDGYTDFGSMLATGIYVYANDYDASVTNSGTVIADASGYAFYGITAVGIDAMAPNGDATVTNSGTVTATAYGYGFFYGVVAYGISGYSIDGDVAITNSGSVGASAENDSFYESVFFAYGPRAYGISGYSFDGDVSVTNSGTVSATATDTYSTFSGVVANGIYAGSVFGDVAVSNSGTVSASVSSNADLDGDLAQGIYAYAYDGDTSVTNSGMVSADASGWSVYSMTAVGIDAMSYFGDTSVTNSGTVEATAYGYGFLYGVVAYGISGYSVAGAVTITNSGSVSATATDDPDYGAFGTLGASAYGISGYSYFGDVAVTNSGTVSATASDSYYNAYSNRADGIYAGSVYGDATVTNSGVVSASATSYAGYYGNVAHGIYAYSFDGDATVSNSGSVSASVGGFTYYNGYSATTSVAIGIDANSYNYAASVGNSGTVSATAEYGNAIGVLAIGYTDVTVVNSGDINATAVGSHYIGPLPDEYVYVGGLATGVLALGYGDVTVDNSGHVTVDAYVASWGIDAETIFGSVNVDNSGTVTVTAGPDYYFAAYATGIYALNQYGEVTVANSGLIDVTAAAGFGPGEYEYTLVGSSVAIGVYAQSYGYADVLVDNSGTISATATSYSILYGPSATGVIAYSTYGDVEVNNSGLVSATARANYFEFNGAATAVGVSATQIGYGIPDYNGNLLVLNSGTISADASAYYGSASATGVQALTIYGNLDVESSGHISATATSGDYSAYSYTDATGISAANLSPYYDVYGNVNVSNSGTVDAIATGGYSTYFSNALAIGIDAESAEGAVTVYNGGAINATASAGVDSVYAFDNQADAYGIVGYSYDGDVFVINAGDVTATASSGGDYGYANATGVWVLIGVDGYGLAGVYTYGGSITANAEDHAVGIQVQSYGGVYGGYVVVGNSGSVEANAIGGDNPIAIGVEMDGSYAIFLNDDNDDGRGSISASAISDADYGIVYATGVHIDADQVGFYAYSDEEEAYVFYSGFHNYGDISAYASGYAGDAVGVYIHSYSALLAYNDGDISAEAAGSAVEAVGFFAGSDIGGVDLVNYGNIIATAEYQATGVWLGTASYTNIYNFGTIEASGADYNYAIDTSYGGSLDFIYNYGTITGAIRTGAADDYLYNGADGTWNATGVSTFGDGDDGIMNYGLIAMDNATIDLGYSDVSGNFFYNYGTLSIEGTNVINMGDGPLGPLVPSLNPLAFYNGIGGVIDFQDGDADDMLTIIGDFAGDGDINVDVSGLAGTSDILYIDGSVVDGTSATINVDLLDLPESIESVVPMVYVSGDSVASNFTLGDVTWDEDDSFVTLDFSLLADIDATNATPDVFSLGIEVTGLSDPGTLAASVGASVQSLMNTQVGTWRQRMGVIDSFNKGAIALWARVFSSEGSFSPEHENGNFGQGGNFDWEQKNSGVEGGIDFSVTDEFSIGLLLSKSQADTDLDVGNGDADIDADTWGIYGTWISPNGFYLDASYRWMNFDVDLNSVAGNMETEGDAEAFNVELGYAWTLSGGLKIEPQLQYTKTSVNNIDTLVTSTGMTFSHDGGDSSRGRLGVAIRKSFGEADTGWLWTPYATLSAVREFDGETLFIINDTFVGATNVEGTSALLELGFTARHQNWSIYGGLNWEDGGAIDSFFGGQLGVRYTFGGPAPAPAPVAPPPAKTCAELDDDGDGVNNCDDKCLGSTAGEQVGPDGCPVPPPPPAEEPKPFRG